MYTITVKISASGTFYKDPNVPHNSYTGHMWYSLAGDGIATESFGFAPVVTEMDGPGEVKKTDDAYYSQTYYTGTIVIDKYQYDKLMAFGQDINLNGNPFDFSSHYNGLTNSCIDYTWKALNIIDINPSDFEGQLWPTHNADDADVALYKYLMGDTSGWNEALPDAGDYHVIYGSGGGETLSAENNTDAMYGGAGNDMLTGNNLENTLVGGDGTDTLEGGAGKDVFIGGFTKTKVDAFTDTLHGGAGYDTYYTGDSDHIKDDSEGDGKVYFEGQKLTGGVMTGVSGSTRIYEGDGGIYRLSGNLLTFTQEGKILTIENFHKLPKDLEINLRDKGEIKIFINDKTEYERMERMNFTVSIKSDFPLDEPIMIYTNIGDVTIPVGATSGSVIYKWENDFIQECKDEVFKVTINGTDYRGEMTLIHTDTGIGTIKDDDPEGSCPQPVKPCFPYIPLPTPVVQITSSSSSIVSVYYSGGGGGGGGGSSTPHYSSSPPVPKIECINEPAYNSVATGGGGGSTGPIVLDLNRDGITSISLAASTALFDYDGDGVLENTAWTQTTDALLVNDANNDGIINNATELFGNYTKNSDGSIAKSGYQALSYYDTNSDGVVNATDTRFEELNLWIDSNQDGVTDQGELKILNEMGVTSLTLNDPITPYAPTIENTNTIIQETTFTRHSREDGNPADIIETGIMRDILFRYENTSKITEGLYFDMDGNGIQEKMMTWTDPNQWMIVKDINGDGKITTADNSGLAFWTDRNHNGLTDVGELEALGAAGAIQTIKLNPYQTLLSGYDNNQDVITANITKISNNNTFKQNIFTYTFKSDIINNYFYLFERKAA